MAALDYCVPGELLIVNSTSRKRFNLVMAQLSSETADGTTEDQSCKIARLPQWLKVYATIVKEQWYFIFMILTSIKSYPHGGQYSTP